MKYCQAEQGRTFVIRLQDGDVVHEQIEAFACEHDVTAGSLIILGGADQGSRLVVGPEDGRAKPVNPMETVINRVHEIAGVGTLFPDKQGKPVLHMHMACGREESTVIGCVRRGVKVWHVMEVILSELLNCDAARVFDPATGFELLEP